MTKNSKWNTKVTYKTMVFWNFHFLYTQKKFIQTKVRIIHENIIISSFLKWLVYSIIFIFFHQVFIILILPWIHQLIWTINLKYLNESKNRFSLFVSYFIRTKTISLSLFFHTQPKNQDFDSKLLKVYIAIRTHDSWSLTRGSFSCSQDFLVNCLEKIMSLNDYMEVFSLSLFMLNFWTFGGNILTGWKYEIKLFQDMFTHKISCAFGLNRKFVMFWTIVWLKLISVKVLGSHYIYTL